MRRRLEDGSEELPPDNPFPDPEEPPPPDPGIPPRIAEMIEARDHWVEALTYWQTANVESAAQRFANAKVAYEISQRAVLGYFQKYYTNSPLHLTFNFTPGASTAEKLGVVVNGLFDKKDNYQRYGRKFADGGRRLPWRNCRNLIGAAGLSPPSSI